MMFLSALTKVSAPHILLNLYLWVSPFDSGAAALQSSCSWSSMSLSKEDSLASESARLENEVAGQRNPHYFLLQGLLA